MSIDFDPTKMSADQFKAALKLLEKEKPNRGPSGLPKVRADLPQVIEGADFLDQRARDLGTDVVTLIDAILRRLQLPFTLQSKYRGKPASTNAKDKPEGANG